MCNAIALWLLALFSASAIAQVAPSGPEKAAYKGLFAAAARGDASAIKSLVAGGAGADSLDGYGRTPLHVAAYGAHHDAMRALVAAGANPNALENDRYDIVTIAAVANDLPTLKLSLALGASARNTSAATTAPLSLPRRTWGTPTSCAP